MVWAKMVTAQIMIKQTVLYKVFPLSPKKLFDKRVVAVKECFIHENNIDFGGSQSTML